MVEWTPSGGSASTVSTGSATASYTKTSLTNGTAVAFRVAAVNSVGQGAWSSSVSVTPAASGPSFTNVSADTGFTNVSGANTSTLSFTFDPATAGTAWNVALRCLYFTVPSGSNAKVTIPSFGGTTWVNMDIFQFTGTNPPVWDVNKDGTSYAGFGSYPASFVDSSLAGTDAANNKIFYRAISKLPPGNYAIRATFGTRMGSLPTNGYILAAVSCSMTLSNIGSKTWPSSGLNAEGFNQPRLSGLETDTLVGTGHPSGIQGGSSDASIRGINLTLSGTNTITFNRISGTQSNIWFNLNAGSYSANGWTQNKQGSWTTTNLSSATSVTFQSATTRINTLRAVGPTSGTNAQRMHTIEFILS